MTDIVITFAFTATSLALMYLAGYIHGKEK